MSLPPPQPLPDLASQASETNTRARRRARAASLAPWYAVFALTVAYMHSNVARQLVPMFVGPIQQDLGLSDVGISLAGGFAFAIFYSVMGVPLGRLVDRADRRQLILLGIAFWTLMTAVCGWSASLLLFLVGRIGLGVSEAAVVPASLSIFHDLFPRQRLALAVNTFFTGVWLGNGLAFVIGAYVLQSAGPDGVIDLGALGAYRSWQFAFLAVAVAGLPVYALSFFIKEPKRPAVSVHAPPDTAAGSTSIQDILKTFRSHPHIYWGVFVGITVYSTAVSGAAFWAVEYLVRTFGSDRAGVSYLYGIQGFVVGSVGLLASGWLADRWERSGALDAKIRVAIASLLLLVPLGACFLWAASEIAGLALFVAVTFLTPVAYGTSTAALQSVTPSNMQGLITGLFTFVTNALGMGLGPTLVAVVNESALPGVALAEALAIVLVVLLPVAVVCLSIALRPYRARVAHRST